METLDKDLYVKQVKQKSVSQKGFQGEICIVYTIGWLSLIWILKNKMKSRLTSL